MERVNFSTIAKPSGVPRRGPRLWPSLLGLVLVGAVVGGIVLFATSTNGSKQAGLGTTLIGSGGIGGVLFFLGQALQQRVAAETQHVEQRVKSAAQLASTPPGQPVVDEEAPRVHEVFAADELHVADEEQLATAAFSAPKRFNVEYDGWQRDTRRIDANQARFRVRLEDGTYFQFFAAIMSGIDINTALGSQHHLSRPQFRRAVLDVATELAQDAIEAGRVPLEENASRLTCFLTSML